MINMDICYLVVCILIVYMIFFTKSKKEGFSYKYSEYPTTIPLSDTFKLKKKPKLSPAGYDTLYKEYPIFPANSSLTNNIRDISKPTNGTCSPSDFCNSLFENTPQPKHFQPKPLNINLKIRRVNFYEAE